MTLNLMASQLHMNWEMGCLILYEILEKKFLLHNLSDQQQ
jgi:hypothetical protein